MLRKVAVFLCVAGIVSASQVQHGPPLLYNVGTQSPASFSTPVPPLDIQNAQLYYKVPLEAKLLRSQLPQFQGISGGPAYVKNSDTVSINAAVVKTITPVEVPVGNKVTVEAHQQVTAHPPTVTRVSGPPVPIPVQPAQYHVQTVNRPAVQYVAVPIEFLQANQFASKPVFKINPPIQPRPQPIQYVQTVAQPPAVQYVSTPVDYGVYSEAVNPVAAVPVDKKVTIEAHQSVTAHPPSAPNPPVPVVFSQTISRPAVKYVSIPFRQPSIQVKAFPQKSVTVYPPPAEYVTSTVAPIPINRPAVKFLPVAPTVPAFAQVASKNAYETVTAYPPSAAYITSTELPLPKPTVASNTVTIESHQSVTAHPPTSTVAPVQQIQTVVNPSPVQYVPAPAAPIVNKPIPVPVYFSAEEAQEFQYAVTKNVQPAPLIVKQQVPVTLPQPIPVPVLYPKNEAFIKYNSKVSTPLVYTKSIVEKDHVSADLVATHVTSGDAGYSRAAAYSPASAVSSVSFNGLGVSYGW